MRMSLDDNEMAHQISHFDAEKFTINKRDYKVSIVASVNKILCPWTEKSASQLTTEDFTPILNCKPQIIIIGTGSQMVALDPQIIAAVQSQKVGIEVMDTAAAVRTFNVLISEGRNVAAGLLL